tara:strand:- start:3494 stop:4270 length:777 start_codon:yes stop_codon:yes gene_type:complete
MTNSRKTSLDQILLPEWRWEYFFKIIYDYLLPFDLYPYPISKEFLNRQTILGSKTNSYEVNTATWACSAPKIRQARAACLTAGEKISVLNFVITPSYKLDLPFFGADLVTLPSGHLIALDFQPALKNDHQHTKNVWDQLLPLHSKWQALLPSGGPVPEEAEPFFSPGFLWTRLPLGQEGDEIISKIIQPAFIDYFSLYLDLLSNANEVENQRSLNILDGQKRYMKYRSEKDPAKAMLTRFYGEKWTKNYINRVLFDLQ